ncbi:MAG: hypothetical protein ACOX5Z_02470 [Desulfobulbus sp.]|jgi:hypothetical protein
MRTRWADIRRVLRRLEAMAETSWPLFQGEAALLAHCRDQLRSLSDPPNAGAGLVRALHRLGETGSAVPAATVMRATGRRAAVPYSEAYTQTSQTAQATNRTEALRSSSTRFGPVFRSAWPAPASLTAAAPPDREEIRPKIHPKIHPITGPLPRPSDAVSAARPGINAVEETGAELLRALLYREEAREAKATTPQQATAADISAKPTGVGTEPTASPGTNIPQPSAARQAFFPDPATTTRATPSIPAPTRTSTRASILAPLERAPRNQLAGSTEQVKSVPPPGPEATRTWINRHSRVLSLATTTAAAPLPRTVADPGLNESRLRAWAHASLAEAPEAPIQTATPGSHRPALPPEHLTAVPGVARPTSGFAPGTAPPPAFPEAEEAGDPSVGAGTIPPIAPPASQLDLLVRAWQGREQATATRSLHERTAPPTAPTTLATKGPMREPVQEPKGFEGFSLPEHSGSPFASDSDQAFTETLARVLNQEIRRHGLEEP